MKYEIIRHGVEREQYFQGCGVSFTPYDYCVTGIGSSELEAYNDALDMIAQGDHNELVTSSDHKTFPDKPRGMTSRILSSTYAEDAHWYVSIRYCLPKWFKDKGEA